MIPHPAARFSGASLSGVLNKLGEHFFACLCADFETHGADVIRQLCEQNQEFFSRSSQVSCARSISRTRKYDDVTT
jgi:hypothetical protein